ncbi:MAG: SUMF1/EgtB/PvdO family nonheme iron enzyme [Gemmatimonadota bacterium]|nr:SUMF1/EgtB/PvdO family nonheme iron enzyme [Gemmatimonadota bacterium]MDH3369407.1 SUMF1/EgtB/PvdO family nonheme iron enzyme [Gemmatimonadota bacterium]MDH3477772.1 SUMF1/EgtB/PvdO family nonheme iron enzyme [Gemmatimonadota bacterium]MDH3569075.1 SUMF1/EgtB/PvdO family nonheme iron enzyme [Gemmatimonadota bacterium]MDH5550796.1 SUMF1/EgtB/PvdO family nonheme iron enzyme [Gemmatimonadota bacterium]
MSEITRLSIALADRYTIERELGAGGMASVYLAHDVKHDRKVAVKVLRPELAAVLGAERFVQEIKTTANLQHPHILALFDSGEADSFLYYVMPYVEGESLRDRLNREGRLPVDEALAIIGDVAAALTAAHAQGIVHRDIKPENILVKDGEGLVADFGIALAVSLVSGDRLTATGLAIGTPAYMSPEQISGEQAIDGRSDIYALGCVLFELLTGEPPFTGPTAQAVIAHSLVDAPRSARALRQELPTEIDAALTRALAKQPEARFDTPRAFLDACTPSPALPKRRRWSLVGVTMAIALVAAVALPLWRSGQTARARTLLPVIEEFADQGNYIEAFDLAVEAERRLSGDTTLARLFETVSDLLTISTEPAGARVYLQRLASSGEETRTDSVFIGTTPLQDVRMARAEYRVVVEKDAYATLERIASSAFGRSELRTDGRAVELLLTLSAADAIPPDMVAVPGGPYELVSPDVPRGLRADLEPYAIDRFEVTNHQYGEFVRSAGFTTPAFWQHAAADGVDPSEFVDRTALPGPRTWTSQEAPSGEGRHPVAGVSWYEAAAFCASVGKRLPTLFEWEKAARDGVSSRRGVIMPWGFMSAAAQTERRANFSGAGTMPVDSMRFGISAYGAYAMAGNVKEWLANPAGDGFVVVGGSWQDPAYVFSGIGSLPGVSATSALGFRCARAAGPAAGERGAGRLKLDAPTPVYRPVDAATYETLLSFYRYDRQPSGARGVEVVETADWSREQLWLNGVGGDSILAYLYLPKRAAPPFQTLVYVASAGAFFFQPVWQQAEDVLGPHIKTGRAVLAVVFKGMVGRAWPADFVLPPTPSVRFRDLMVLHATELRLAIDYLETRGEIDMERLAYVALSFGAGSRLSFAAVDDRYRSVVLIGAGIDERMQPTLPEAANFNFAPYIKPPKLVVNGRLDEEHPWNTRALPLWNLLREPKELVLVDGAGHHPPVEQHIPPIKAFLDRTLGPVVMRQN